MRRSDRSSTRLIAEIGLDRAQPVLARIAPQIFDSLDLAKIVASTVADLEPDSPYRDDVYPRLAAALGQWAPTVFGWIDRFPAGSDEDYPATSYWLTTLWDIEGKYAPVFESEEKTRDWAALVSAYGRTTPQGLFGAGSWLEQIASDRAEAKIIDAVIAVQRAQPLTRHDRSLYARFRWNDDGDQPALTGIATGIWRLRLQRAWQFAKSRFDGDDRMAIERAATALALAGFEERRAEAQQTIEADAARYGVSPDDIIHTLYAAPIPVPPLAEIERETL